MRKTKKLTITLKGLFLVFALCLFISTQSNAQSKVDRQQASTSYTIESDNIFDFSEWNFFQWLQKIVTTDMTRKQRPAGDTPNSNAKKRFIGNGTPFIVTDDMSIRDGGN